MMSTTYRDGYGLAVEMHHGIPHVCQDGDTRAWIGITVTEDEFQTDPTVLHLEVLPEDARGLAAALLHVADVTDGGAR